LSNDNVKKRRCITCYTMRFPCSRLILLPLALAVGACGIVSQPQHGKISLPVAWKNSGNFPVGSTSRDLTQWWSRFDDPVLSKLISAAMAANPNIASASARIREARARRDAEYATLFPTLSGSLSNNSRATDTDASGFNRSNNYSAGLDASWESDFFGKRQNSLAAATAQLGATEENFNSVQASLAAEIATAYTNLRATEATRQVLQRNLKTREQTYQLASWRKQAGEADSLESSQALSSLEQARAGLPLLDQRAANNRNLITLLSGKTPGSFDALLVSGNRGIPNPPRSLAIGIPADTLRQRPDVRIAGYQLLAAAARARAAEAARFPSLNLSGTLGLNSLTAGKLFNPQTLSAGLIAGISSPIFDAGRIRSNILAEYAIEDQTFETYRSTILTALSETEDALISCKRTAERLAILEKATTSAREADLIARQRYQTGEIDFLTVLDAQRTLLGLEDSLFSVSTARTIAYIQLYKALGGGWSPRS
jgi:outer membrane protein, multidrug efflux system